jgi:hypothetical protein
MAVEAGRVSNVVAAGGSKTVAQARNGWIRIVGTVLDVLEHSDAPAAAVETIRDPVVQAAQRAAARNAARQSLVAPADDEAQAPAPPDAPAVTGKYAKA